MYTMYDPMTGVELLRSPKKISFETIGTQMDSCYMSYTKLHMTYKTHVVKNIYLYLCFGGKEKVGVIST